MAHPAIHLQLCAMVRIAILASGSGTNAQRLMEHFAGSTSAEVALVGCDQPRARVVQRAWDMGVPCYVFSAQQLNDRTLEQELEFARIELIVLAGFMRLIPATMVQAWPDRILNIHPALLPAYGGKGMYGDRVHRAVLAGGEAESGITIHLVNEQYDQGRVLFQARCPVHPGEDFRSLAARIHALEHQHYPEVVEQYIQSIGQ